MARHFSNEPDPHIIASLEPVTAACLLWTATIAILILTLWFIPGLDAYAPHFWKKMTALTGLAMLFATACLVLTEPNELAPWRRLGLAAAILVLLIGVFTLSEYAIHSSFGFDVWLPSDPHAAYPGRPSPQTALGFVLFAVCVLAGRQTKGKFSSAADISTLLLIALILVMCGGHLYGAVDLVGINASTLMAPHTLACFVALTIAIVIRRAAQGEMLSVLVNIGIGSRIVRMLLPAAIAAPFIFLAVEARIVDSHFVSAPYAQAIAAASAAFAILCIATWMGRRINALERDLRDLSLTDELTGIYNRRGFYFLGAQAIREAEQAHHRLALFFFDLDGLKRVNDLHGHESGSEMIQAFAELLTSAFHNGDIIGRVGGDEFAVITNRQGAPRHAQMLANLNELANAFNTLKNQKFTLNFSAGCAELNPATPETLDDLVMRADEMMYREKAKKKQLA